VIRRALLAVAAGLAAALVLRRVRAGEPAERIVAFAGSR
jgi:hypothetical protein